ncbi:ATP phosphoribosyltransferase regulatory subunit [Frankia sp. Cr2]|uniref:ATP phosphoribosyltransferase regulatory subunit n=1 Tax=Frankia sp. Cr2 TaxID=3073932 RepID=UPI002AD4C427|nr:ATP phosphoribosyltransferase regulatory subunit [Frankia sp. Cr2]
MSQLTAPLAGTHDRFGAELRRRDYVTAVLAEVVRARGYERLAMPILERASSFAEDVIGLSPWPEWHPAGVFHVEITDFADGYRAVASSSRAVLIPEGTVPVARWLAGCLAGEGNLILPLKIFYDVPCHRNEPVDTLSATKRREFSQFGVEILGAANPAADVEILTVIRDGLVAVGVPPAAVRVRLNNVEIFNQVVGDCGLVGKATIALKEILDALAECRAGKDPGRAAGLRAALAGLLDDRGVTGGRRAACELLAGHASGYVDDRVRTTLGGAAREQLDALAEMQAALVAVGIPVSVDFGVVRSHEYYTGLAFEVDVTTGAGTQVEIAGGGRYDKLVGHFLPPDGPAAVPSTGFAFGVERVVATLAELGVFTGSAARTTVDRFDPASAEILLVPPGGQGPVAGYLHARAAADRLRPDRRVDIWVGDTADPTRIAGYTAARHISEVRAC